MDMLKMTNITKSFSGVTVLKDVSFTVGQGEVHALLGENGAGKSTLMNILAGVHPRDAGTVEFDGRPLEHTTVKLSESVGIAFVHQELNLFNDLKVFENIFLRKEILTKVGTLNKKAMIAKTRELFDNLGVNIEPTAMVSDLETSKKQLLEIAKALFANAKLLILDEPTTSLNQNEIDSLFAIVRRLKEQGKSFIFISHKMNEIFAIADRYTVLRNGEFIESGNIADTTMEDVTRLMVGNSYSQGQVYRTREVGEPILELHNLTGEGFRNIDLTVRRGEIIGMTGLKGAGVSEMMRAVFGVTPILGGTLKIAGTEIKNNKIHKAMVNKIAMVAANRKENSVIPDFTLLENNYVSEHTLSAGKQLIRRKKEVERYDNMKQMLSIKANSHADFITSLSGGNQQKVILARWLLTHPQYLILDEPTRGIDVGTKTEIQRLVRKLAEEGMSVTFISSEIEEMLRTCSRLIVMRDRHIVGELRGTELSQDNVMRTIAGGDE